MVLEYSCPIDRGNRYFEYYGILFLENDSAVVTLEHTERTGNQESVTTHRTQGQVTQSGDNYTITTDRGNYTIAL